MIWYRSDRLIHHSIQNTFHLLYHHKVLHVKQEMSFLIKHVHLVLCNFIFSKLEPVPVWTVDSSCYSIKIIDPWQAMATTYWIFMLFALSLSFDGSDRKFSLCWLLNLLPLDAYTGLRVAKGFKIAASYWFCKGKNMPSQIHLELFSPMGVFLAIHAWIFLNCRYVLFTVLL